MPSLYGAYKNANDASLSMIQKFHAKTLLDVELTWDVTAAVRSATCGRLRRSSRAHESHAAHA
jgi:hypothetical protein